MNDKESERPKRKEIILENLFFCKEHNAVAWFGYKKMINEEEYAYSMEFLNEDNWYEAMNSVVVCSVGNEALTFNDCYLALGKPYSVTHDHDFLKMLENKGKNKNKSIDVIG